MKRKKIILLVVMAVFFSIMFFVTIAPKVKQGTERLDTPAVGIKRNKLMETDNRSGFTEVNNITHAKICAEQWRLDIITSEEALRCIDRYIESTR